MRSSFSKGIAFTWFFGLFGVVITALSLVYNVHLQRAADIERADRISHILVELAAAETGRVLYGLEQLLGGLEGYVTAPDSLTDSGGAIDGVLSRRAAESPFLVELLLLDPQGRVLHRGGRGAVPEVGGEFSLPRRARSASGVHVGEPFRSSVYGGRRFFEVSRELRGTGGALAGVAVALVDLERFRALYAGMERLSGSRVTLAAPSGALYLRIPAERTPAAGRSVAAQRFWESGLAAVDRIEQGCPAGQRCTATARRVEGYPLVAMAGVDLASMVARSREVAWVALVIGLLVAGGILALTAMLVREQRAQQRAVEALERMAREDYLTGLLNRREVMERAAEELERARRYGSPLSLVMLDVDHFKQVNDRYGHPTGDVTLKQVAEVLRDCCRRSDRIGRYGGEEFLLVLPETVAEGARRMAEKVRRRLAACTVKGEGGSVRVTASLGVVQYDGREALDDLVTRVDKALYRAKEEGRNRVVSVEHELPPPAMKRAVGS